MSQEEGETELQPHQCQAEASKQQTKRTGEKKPNQEVGSSHGFGPLGWDVESFWVVSPTDAISAVSWEDVQLVSIRRMEGFYASLSKQIERNYPVARQGL